MARSHALHKRAAYVRGVGLELVPMNTLQGFVLVLHLLSGDMAYDDMPDEASCHQMAEALKEGGALEIEGIGVLAVETAECISRATLATKKPKGEA